MRRIFHVSARDPRSLRSLSRNHVLARDPRSPLCGSLSRDSNRKKVSRAGMGGIWVLSGIALAGCSGAKSAIEDAVNRLVDSTTTIKNRIDDNPNNPIGTEYTIPNQSSAYSQYSMGSNNLYEATVAVGIDTVYGTVSEQDRVALGNGPNTLSLRQGDDFAYEPTTGVWGYNRSTTGNETLDLRLTGGTGEGYNVDIRIIFGEGDSVSITDSPLIVDASAAAAFIAEPDTPAPAGDESLTLLAGGAITIADTATTDSDGNRVLEINIAPMVFAVNGGGNGEGNDEGNGGENGGETIAMDSPPAQFLESGTYHAFAELTQDGGVRVVFYMIAPRGHDFARNPHSQGSLSRDADAFPAGADADAPANVSRHFLGTLTIDTDTPENSGFTAADTLLLLPQPPEADGLTETALTADIADGDIIAETPSPLEVI